MSEQQFSVNMKMASIAYPRVVIGLNVVLESINTKLIDIQLWKTILNEGLMVGHVRQKSFWTSD